MSDPQSADTELSQRPSAKAYHALALPTGHTILEYSVQSTLGGGGFGITYLARDVNLALPVAIKEYLPADMSVRNADHSVHPNSDKAEAQFRWGLERFLDEARTLATFRHPNIVRVLRYFEANGTAYIVMEYESGESLKQWLPRHTPMDSPTLMTVIEPLMDGLELIHKAGFLHRDVKPDNIYIRRDGTPVLLDFGAARRVSTGQDLTSVVSPGFAPFEQYHSSGNQGPWTDLYSLAAVMYWMISGEKPVDAAARLRKDSLIPAVQMDHNLLFQPALLKAVDWALSPDEGNRPQSVAEFRQRLLAVEPPDPTVIVAQPSSVTTVNLDGFTRGQIAQDLTRSSINNTRRNMMCTVMYIAIGDYPTISANEQFERKSEFNRLMAEKLSHVPDSARITLDTGDGVAICFMGDPEDVLLVAIDIQRALRAPSRLHLRIGLHVGPVRILNDINGRENVIGDGLNVAQRIMGFAAPGHILVSRAYYDVVSRLSDDGVRRFVHMGEQRDNTQRVHELYQVQSNTEMGAEPQNTIPLPATTPASHVVGSAIDPGVQKSIERELARLIGPLASVLVRKAAQRAGTPDEMRELLAQGVSDPTQRQAFLDGTLSVSQTSAPGGRTTPTLTPSVPTSSAPSTRPWLPDDAIALLEKQLTQVIGPVAKVVLKKEIRKAVDYQQLCQALAQHIDNADGRNRFLKAIKAVS